MPRLRYARATDEPFLWDMLYFAAHMDEDGAWSAEDARGDPVLSKYVEGWGREGDLGVIAEDDNADPIGAAWLRPLAFALRGYALVPEEYPELVVAVVPGYEGQGIGGRLLTSLLSKAQGAYPGVVLSVRDGNPAIRLYERFGFDIVDEIVNRVGGRSFVMALSLE